MSIDYKKYLVQLTPIIRFAKKYRFLLICTFMVGSFVFVINRINTLTAVEMNQERYDQELIEIKRITFDEEAIDAIKALQDRDVEVDLELPSNRENPF